MQHQYFLLTIFQVGPALVSVRPLSPVSLLATVTSLARLQAHSSTGRNTVLLATKLPCPVKLAKHDRGLLNNLSS